ncbi:hyaluronoglucosaminidase [Teladorsagia circumcincta]|uniref:Hyaluronidase n=1 Tax=Teladorsagia circumcincta TaxID=45464 RepID=A0A2G9URV2_TELCI|nr:hyaluronoglucosaminidase [Teladorsagia circumcincta]
MEYCEAGHIEDRVDVCGTCIETPAIVRADNPKRRVVTDWWSGANLDFAITNLSFHGEKVALFYEFFFGRYPYYKHYNRSLPINGGTPQNLTKDQIDLHLNISEYNITKVLPENASGLAIIDFEEWRPLFRQNVNKKKVYQEAAFEIVAKKNLSVQDLNDTAKVEYNEAAKDFILKTIEKAKELRPNASWGLYGFPYCNYDAGKKGKEKYNCSKDYQQYNDEYHKGFRMMYIFNASTALFPSIYYSSNATSEERFNYVQAILREANRIAQKYKPPLPIFPYTKFEYDPLNHNCSFYSDLSKANDFETFPFPHQSMNRNQKSGLWGNYRMTTMCENNLYYWHFVEEYVDGMSGQKFLGKEIVLFYEKDFGEYPYYKEYDPKQPINGGLPQNASLARHLLKVGKQILEGIPDPLFDGLAVIDFEHWRPLYAMNWDKKKVYQKQSLNLVLDKNRSMLEEVAKNVAESEFNEAARNFFVETIKLARRLRSKAHWGYYHYPFCNARGNHSEYSCSQEAKGYNDKLAFLYSASDALFPSIYLNGNKSAGDAFRYVQAVLNETERIAKEQISPLKFYMYTKFEYDPALRDVVRNMKECRNKKCAGVKNCVLKRQLEQ